MERGLALPGDEFADAARGVEGEGAGGIPRFRGGQRRGVIGPEQGLDTGPQLGISTAFPVQVGGTFARISEVRGELEDLNPEDQ